MMERESEILSKTIDVLKKHVDPSIIYLFGSRVKGTHRKGSDFDFAVTGKDPSLQAQRSIENGLKEFLGLYSIDIVYLDSIEEDFRELILDQGKIIYER